MTTKTTSANLVVQIKSDVKEVACDGGGVMGHPLVYLAIGNDQRIVCYYCGKRFEKKPPQGQ